MNKPSPVHSRSAGRRGNASRAVTRVPSENDPEIDRSERKASLVWDPPLPAGQLHSPAGLLTSGKRHRTPSGGVVICHIDAGALPAAHVKPTLTTGAYELAPDCLVAAPVPDSSSVRTTKPAIAESYSSVMQVGILGPTVACGADPRLDEEVEQALSENNARGALAMLLLRANQFVTQTQLSQLLSDDPRSRRGPTSACLCNRWNWTPMCSCGWCGTP